jgi:hypothetical protein
VLRPAQIQTGKQGPKASETARMFLSFQESTVAQRQRTVKFLTFRFCLP